MTRANVNRGRINRLPVYDAVDSAITGGLRAEIDSSLARQGEVLDLLADAFGPYPFNTVGPSSTTRTTDWWQRAQAQHDRGRY